MMFSDKPYKSNVLSYHGPVTIDWISFMVGYIRDMVAAEQPVVIKLYKVFVELVQNVSFYSIDIRNNIVNPTSRRGTGWVTIEELDNTFAISTGNLIRNEHGPILQKNCNEINSLNEEELRELKRKTRSQADVRDVGAHIGLIHTGLISGSRLEFAISPIDESYSFFRIGVKVQKTINN
jgi:hypothetical protein